MYVYMDFLSEINFIIILLRIVVSPKGSSFVHVGCNAAIS